MGIMSAVGGLMMNLYVIGTCLFQRIQLINLVTGEVIPGEQRGYGFLSRETDYGIKPDYRQCTWYPQDEYDNIFDGWMKTGRFFAFASAVLATVGFLVMLMTCCVAFSRSMFEKWLFWMYIWAAILVALSFFIFGSEYCQENDCKVADGCGWAISAFMFHLLAANTVKSFPIAKAPNHQPNRRNKNRNKKNDDDYNDDDDDDDLDDLYYENEADKYPPLNPDGPRGVHIDKNGGQSFDDGEDYYDDMGRMIDNNDKRGKYQRADDEDDGADLDDISDHDLDQYASDNDDDEDDMDNNRATKTTRQAKPNEANGNHVFDPDAIEQTGNLGVGYENENPEFGREYDDGTNDHQHYDNSTIFDEYGNPMPREDDNYNAYDRDPNSGYQHQADDGDYDGDTVDQQSQQQYSEFGNSNYNPERAVARDKYGESPNPVAGQSSSQPFDDDAFSHQGSVPSSSNYSIGNYTDDATDQDDSTYQTKGASIGQEQESHRSTDSNRRFNAIYDDDDEDYSGPVFT
jgi:hypothetical protein